MNFIIGFVVLAIIAGAIIGLRGGTAKDAVAGAAAGGFVAGSCLLQSVLSVLPFIVGFFIIGAVLKSCSH